MPVYHCRLTEAESPMLRKEMLKVSRLFNPLAGKPEPQALSGRLVGLFAEGLGTRVSCSHRPVASPQRPFTTTSSDVPISPGDTGTVSGSTTGHPFGLSVHCYLRCHIHWLNQLGLHGALAHPDSAGTLDKLTCLSFRMPGPTFTVLSCGSWTL
jgi:hypothetical protein